MLLSVLAHFSTGSQHRCTHVQEWLECYSYLRGTLDEIIIQLKVIDLMAYQRAVIKTHTQHDCERWMRDL